MYTYETAKKKCKELLEKVNNLYTATCRSIINRELDNYSSIDSALSKVRGNNYLLNEKIEIFSGDGLLTIDDRRGKPYRWVFELEIENQLWLTDNIFEEERLIGTVEFLTADKYDIYKNQVETIIQNLELSKAHLSSGEVESWNFHYLCADLGLKADDLNDVFEHVIHEDWKNY